MIDPKERNIDKNNLKIRERMVSIVNACERMTKLLEEQGKTERELADYLDISYNTVRIWKNKQPIPSAEHLVAISEFLGVSVKYLLSGEAEQYKEKLSSEQQEIVHYFNKLNELRKNEVLWYTKILVDDEGRKG